MTILGNGSHPDSHPGFFEWWYFHLLTNEGWFVSFILHSTDLFAMSRSGYVSMSLRHPDGRPYHFRKDVVFEQSISEFLFVDSDGVVIRESDSDLFVDLKFDHARLQVTITKSGPQLVFGDGTLYEDKLNGTSNYWFVPIVNSPATALLTLFSQTHELTGLAYHDHNWGNARIQDCFSSWLWGHLRFQDGYLVYYYIETTDGNTICRALVHLGEVSYRSLVIRIERLETRQYLWQRELPAAYKLSVLADTGRAFEFDVIIDQLFRTQDYDYPQFTSIYYRAACHTAPNGRPPSIRGEGISEYLFVERK